MLKKFIKKSSNKFIKFLCECFLNVINGNAPTDKSLLENYETSFRHFLSKETSLRKKRQLLVKKFTSTSKHKSLLLPLLEEVVMRAEEFVLIPKRMFVSKQPTRKEILDNPIYKQKAAQLSLQRNNPTDFESKEATEPETNKTNIVNKRKRRRTSSVDLKSELDDGSESVQSFFSDDGEIEPSLKKRQSDFDSIMSEVELMEENKIQ